MAQQSETAHLNAQLQTLSQELWDKIYDYVFTAEPGTRYIDRKESRSLFKRPNSIHLLQVDRTSREKFASSFYGSQAVFVAHSKKEITLSWLESIPAHHRSMIRDLRWPLYGVSSAQWNWDPSYDPRQTLSHATLMRLDNEYGGRGIPLTVCKKTEMIEAFERLSWAFEGVVTFCYEDEIARDLPDYMFEKSSGLEFELSVGVKNSSQELEWDSDGMTDLSMRTGDNTE